MDAAICPWDGYQPATIAFCEARLCALVAEPANAWTSLSKTLVGLLLIPACRRAAVPALWAIVAAAVLQGPLGFALHATGTFWGEALDVCGMFLISGLLVTFALARVRRWSARRLVAGYAALTAGSVVALLLAHPSGIAVFSAQLAAWAALEVVHARAAPGSIAGGSGAWWWCSRSASASGWPTSRGSRAIPTTTS